MEHKVYLLIEQIKHEGERVISAYSTEALAVKEADKLNIPRGYGVLYYVEELEVIERYGI